MAKKPKISAFSEGEDAPEKDRKPREIRPAEELAIVHREKIAYSVQRINDWMDDLKTRATSKKYPITEADRDKIITALNAMLEDFMDATNPEKASAPEKVKFSLD